MGGGGIKENDERNEFKYDIRNFVNVTMYPQYNNNKNKFYVIKEVVGKLSKHPEIQFSFQLVL
jgi:hypothetical protein